MSDVIPPRVPVQIFDSSLNFVAEVDLCSSVTHTRGWNVPGPWSLKINWNITDDTGTIQYAALFEIGGFITIDNDGSKCGIITSIDKPIDEAGKQSQDIVVSGYEPTVIFNRRMVDVPSGSDFYTLNAPAETVIKTAISAQAGPTATNTKRAFSLLSIATDQGRGDTYLLSAAYTELLGELTACSIATRLGWFITLDRANKLLVLDCALGSDLISGNNPSAVFSTNYDTLRSATLKESNEQYKNLATVTGQGTGQLRTVLDVYDSPEPSDMNRFETTVNANNLTSTPDLTLKGSQQLDTFSYTKTLDASILAKSPLTYGTDYNLGDFVTVAAYDFSEDVQITAIQESWAALEYDLVPTFDKAPPTITAQMATATKNQGAVVGNLGYPTSTFSSDHGETKFPDGTMIASIRLNLGTGTQTWTFTTPFKAGTTPVVVANSNSAASRFMSVNNVTNTGCDILGWDDAGGVGTGARYAMAFGQWK